MKTVTRNTKTAIFTEELKERAKMRHHNQKYPAKAAPPKPPKSRNWESADDFVYVDSLYAASLYASESTLRKTDCGRGFAGRSAHILESFKRSRSCTPGRRRRMVKAAMNKEDTRVSIDILGQRFDSILKSRMRSPSTNREMNNKKKSELKKTVTSGDKKQSHYVTLIKNVSNKAKNSTNCTNSAFPKIKSIRRSSNQFKKSKSSPSDRLSTEEAEIVEKQLEEAGIYVKKSSFQERKLIYCPSSNTPKIDSVKAKTPNEVDSREARKRSLFPILVQRNRSERPSSWHRSLRRQKNKEPKSQVTARENMELEKEKTSFKDILENSQSLKDFRKFLQREFSEENLDFWESCCNFAKIQSPKTRRQECQRIYTEFLAPEAPKEINVAHAVKKLAQSNLQRPDENTFAEAQHSIYILMEKDSFSRFLNQRRLLHYW